MAESVERRRLLTAQQAAERAHLTRSGLRTMAARALLSGIELRAPAAEWPDQRTPLYDRERLDEYLAGRPGRGKRAPV